MIDAFLLAWFTHITTKILADLQYHLFGPDAMMEIFENKAENNNSNSNDNKDGSIQIEEVNGKATPEKLEKSKKKDHRRRRTRHLFISDSEGMILLYIFDTISNNNHPFVPAVSILIIFIIHRIRSK